jgi:hypothetical protein
MDTDSEQIKLIQALTVNILGFLFLLKRQMLMTRYIHIFYYTINTKNG